MNLNIALANEEGKYEWKKIELEGSWFPEAFIGTMSNLMRFKEGSDDKLLASVQDVLDTMKVVEAVISAIKKEEFH